MRLLTDFVRPAVLAAISLLACSLLVAQTNTGRILGTVSDSTGAALNGAHVVITDVQRGISRALTTDESGAYVPPDLVPGTYKVKVEATGFTTTTPTTSQLR